MAGNRSCRSFRSFTKPRNTSVTIEVGEQGFIAVDIHGDEAGAARLLRRLAPGINLMEAAVTARPLMPNADLGQGLAELAIGAKEVAR